MDRRDFLKGSLFVAGSTTLISSIVQGNEHIENEDSYIAPKGSTAHGCYVRTFGNVVGSKDFPIRPQGAMVTDGTVLWMAWPSEKGIARGYVRPFNELPASIQEMPEELTFMLSMSRPTCPHYMRWKRGTYFMYTPAPALIERASKLFQREDEASKVQALSDIRFAIFINVAFSGKTNVMEEMAEFESEVRQSWRPNEFWGRYKELLTEARP